jgi:RNA polymerase sigma-70 factor (sigma-E family)
MDMPVPDFRERDPLAPGTGEVPKVAAFDEFVAAQSTRLLRVAYLLTRDHGRAEDLLQTALAKTWQSWRRIDADPESYVRKVLVNTYATWWRRRWKDERPTGRLPEQLYDEVESTVRQDLWAALGRLPRGQRVVVVLRFFEDLSEAETARVLDCSIGTVKSQTARALSRLRIDAALVEGSDV